MNDSEQFMWILLKDKVNTVMDKNPEKLENLDPIMEGLEKFAASEDVEDYELAAKIRNYREKK